MRQDRITANAALKPKKVDFASILVCVVALVSCARERTALVVGGLYSLSGGEGSFQIANILALDPKCVHIRLYKKKFDTRPSGVDPSALSLGTIHDVDGFSMGHLPVTRQEFLRWEPLLIAQATVSEDELDGFRIWQEAKGGCFGD